MLYENADGNELCGSVGDTLHRNPLFCDIEEEVTLCSDSPCLPLNNAWLALIGAGSMGGGQGVGSANGRA